MFPTLRFLPQNLQRKLSDRLRKTSYSIYFFDVLLTAHLSIFISVINQLDAQNFCFTISLFHASTCFEHMCSKHVEAWNKLIVKQKFCASSWLINEINIVSYGMEWFIPGNEAAILSSWYFTLISAEV